MFDIYIYVNILVLPINNDQEWKKQLTLNKYSVRGILTS